MPPRCLPLLVSLALALGLVAAGTGRSAPRPAPDPATVLRGLGSRSWEERRDALDQLAAPALADPRVQAALVRIAVGDSMEFLRYEAVQKRAAAPDSGAGAMPAFRAALDTLAGEPRAKLIEALGQVGPRARAVVPALVAALRDTSADVRTRAGYALSMLGPMSPGTLAALTVALADTTGWPSVAAAWSLGQGGEAALPYVRQAMRDPDPWVRDRAMMALGSMRPPRMAELLAALGDTDTVLRTNAFGALMAIHPRTPEIERALDEAIRREGGGMADTLRMFAAATKDTSVIACRIEQDLPVYAPDSTALVFGQTAETYRKMTYVELLGPGEEDSTLARAYELWTYDLRAHRGPRRAASLRLAAGERLRIAGWDRGAVLVAHGDPPAPPVVRVDLADGAVIPLPGIAADSLRRMASRLHPGSSGYDELRRRHLETGMGEYFEWDPVRRERQLLFTLPDSHDGVPVDGRGHQGPYRERSRYADTVHMLWDATARVTRDSVRLRLETYVPRPGTATREYEVAWTVGLPDTAAEKENTFTTIQQPWATFRARLGPRGTAIERAYPLSGLLAMVRPYCGASRALYPGRWSTSFWVRLRAIPLPADHAHELPPGIVDGNASTTMCVIEVPLPAEWFPARAGRRMR